MAIGGLLEAGLSSYPIGKQLEKLANIGGAKTMGGGVGHMMQNTFGSKPSGFTQDSCFFFSF